MQFLNNARFLACGERITFGPVSHLHRAQKCADLRVRATICLPSLRVMLGHSSSRRSFSRCLAPAEVEWTCLVHSRRRLRLRLRLRLRASR